MLVGHVCPEAADGGLIALLRDSDQITIERKKGNSFRRHLERGNRKKA